MTRTASMSKSRAGGLRKLAFILFIEISFVIALHLLGTVSRMQIDFSNFSRWLDITPPEVALSASIRMLALVIAYWVLATTTVYLIARTLQIPAMLKAMEFATLPFVRKAIDGALAATIIGGTVFGGASAVFAKQDANKVQTRAETTATVQDFRSLYNPVAADDGAAITPVNNEVKVVVQDASVTAPVEKVTTPADATTDVGTNANGENVPVPASDLNKPAAETPVTIVPSTESPTKAPSVEVPVTSTPKKETPVVPTTAPKVTTPTTSPTPDAIKDGEVIVGGERVERTNDNPTSDTPANASGSYTVVSGDNFWNIAKTQVQSSLGRAPSNAETANYWVKLIDSNKSNIRSGDASLIFPGEVFTLPAI
jgi:hypothetical protein